MGSSDEGVAVLKVPKSKVVATRCGLVWFSAGFAENS